MNLSLISKYKKELMGLAIISIMIFHFTEDFVLSGGSNFFIKLYYQGIRSVGVDVFLFLSGVGLYYSYTKDRSAISFYKKRFMRVLPPYILLGGVFWIVKDIIIDHMSFRGFLKDFFMLSFWTDGLTNMWYVSFIILLYIVFPLLYSCYYSGGRPRYCRVIISFACIFAATVLFSVIAETKYAQIEIAITRIPVFCFGVFCGYFIMKEAEIKKRSLVLFISATVMMMVLNIIADYPIWVSRYIRSLWGLALILLACVMLAHINVKGLNLTLKKAGEYSLELYLTHQGIRNIYNILGKPTYILWNYVQVILLSIVLSLAAGKMFRLFSGFSRRVKP